MSDVAEAPRPKTVPLFVLLGLVVGLALGVAIGIQIAPDDEVSVTSTSTSTTRSDSTVSQPSITAAAAPIELEPTLRRYLDALVTHDWRGAHALMCADLADQISAGGLKQELAGSEERAGLLTGYSIGSDLAPAQRTAEVEYVLEFEDGTIDITASMEREGSTWRVCSFTNTGGTGAFAST
jgi:hypothetical protein